MQQQLRERVAKLPAAFRWVGGWFRVV